MAFESPTYDEIVKAVLSYYDSSSPFWGTVNNGTATAAEIYDAYSRLPQFRITRSIDGSVMGTDWSQSLNKLARTDYADPSARDELVNQINDLFSNSRAANYGEGNAYNVNIPGNWGGDGTTGYNVTSGAQITGSPNILATIADKASLAVTGVNIGAKIGAAIDSALYSIDPKWWDEHYPAINPQTWTSLAGENTLGQQFIRMLFGVKDTGVTAYIDERLLAQTYQLFRDTGVFTGGGIDSDYTGSTASFPDPSTTYVELGKSIIRISKGQAGIHNHSDTFTGTDPVYICAYRTRSTAVNITNYLVVSKSPFVYRDTDTTTGTSTIQNINTNTVTYNNTTYYYTLLGFNTSVYEISGCPVNNFPSVRINDRQIATIILDGTITETSGVDGITPLGQDWAYPPLNITGTDLDTVLQQLKQEYPDLFTDTITESTLQDDGTIQDRTYVPVPWAVQQPITDTQTETEENTDPLIDTETQPTTRTETEIETEVDTDTFTDIITRTPTNNPPDEGDGEQEPFVMPVGNASSLWAVYHPSQAQLNAFGAWLWSSNFVEQLKKLFNDPMQAIIGVHKVFAPIPTGGTQTIVCGYLDSGVSSPVVSNQYTEVNCGSVSLPEYYGNVFDYDPHTKVSIYLPFIGVVPLKVSEVMRSTISVTYGVDVITGACLAKVSVSRDGGGAILYSYGGSCACHYPISSGSYAGIISGIVTSAIGIAGGLATGNPLATIGGAMAGLRQAHTEVQRSGGFTGCAGAMGPKKPYLIIDRPQTRLARNFPAYDGKPSNSTQFIGDCSGFIRAQEVHFSAPGAFDDEAKEVENLLKAGVLME